MIRSLLVIRRRRCEEHDEISGSPESEERQGKTEGIERKRSIQQQEVYREEDEG